MRAYRLLVLIAVLGLCADAAVAATPASELTSKGTVSIKFQPAGLPTPEGALVSDGGRYYVETGYGWDKDIRGQARKRADGCTGVALIDRSVSFATFTVDLPNGNYLFEVTARDSEFTGGLAIVLDGLTALPPVQLSAGDSATQVVPVESRNGKAQISFIGGQQGRPNSMINGIRITPASADPAKWGKANDAVSAYQRDARERVEARLAKRVRDRAAYKPVSLKDSSAPRQTVDLSGKWLFMPSQNLAKSSPSDPITDDSGWHVLGVPQFWNPIEWWIYTSVNGTSHNYIRKEVERCDQFTFDYANTHSGWYRQWLDVPASMKGKRLVLKFDAVASMAQVYWNGQPVGSHVGMFGPFECEVTPHVKFGQKNLLAVMVAGGKTDPKAAKDVAAVAVTVNVTREMLNSLPHGWYKPGMGGIWQPARIEITSQNRIADVYFRPRLDGATIETEVSRKSSGVLAVRHTVVDNATAQPLKGGSVQAKVTSGKVISELKGLRPKLWSPEHPNLYRLKTQLVCGDKVMDEKVTTVGFKTFESRGNKLYLNGKPYFMRGADMPPHGLAPNDKALADKFMRWMSEGNTPTTRFHMAPPSQLWMDAADKYGIGVSVGETWPWVLMGNTPIPNREALEMWRTEFRDVVRANRNHPSLMIWTISNESYFQGSQDPDKARRKEKYRIFSDVIKDVRAEHPDAQVVLHSGYVRPQSEYDELLKPDGLDDGDIDDTHEYIGWYQRSPFHIKVSDIEARRGNGTRPLISQEASTGYPDNDTGHPTESYMRDHVVPQAWVGKYGTYATRPDMFLDIQGQITKEYAEKIRRDRTLLAGWMIFANCCWFRDVYDAERITPYPVYWGMQKAYQPVLVSLALHDRHFEAGQPFRGEVVVCNDDPDRAKLTNLSLRWCIHGKSSVIRSHGSVQFPDCAYDMRSTRTVEFRVPDGLPTPRSDMVLELALYQGDELVSRNDYPLICTTREWYLADGGKLAVLESDDTVSAYLGALGFQCGSAKSMDFGALPADTVLVVSPSVDTKGMLDPLSAFVQRGGKALLLGQSVEGLPNLPADKKHVDVSGDFADVLEPALLDCMDPMDMHWWNSMAGDVQRVCRTSYQLPDAEGVTKLVQHIQPHGYIRGGRQLEEYISWPVIEYRVGKGRIIASTLYLADDPISKRFTTNLIQHLAR